MNSILIIIYIEMHFFTEVFPIYCAYEIQEVITCMSARADYQYYLYVYISIPFRIVSLLASAKMFEVLLYFKHARSIYKVFGK